MRNHSKEKGRDKEEGLKIKLSVEEEAGNKENLDEVKANGTVKIEGEPQLKLQEMNNMRCVSSSRISF